MSSASHHAEWLQLVPHTGPFLTLPVLQRVFPQQLEALDSGLRGHTRDAFDDWREQPANPALHRAWILHVLKGVLRHPDEVLAEGQAIPPGLEARQLEHGEVLRPDFVLLNPAGHAEQRRPRLLISVHPPGTDFNKPLPDRRWKASPASRIAELCHAANVPLGLVTDGDHWLLVWAPRGETTGYASWFAHLWSEEPLTFRAFISLLRASRFFAVAPGDTLEALYAESSRDQSEVTDQLGLQVRQAVQVLIQSLDHLDATHGRTLLAGTSEKELYNAALTVMMRLVFLFCAEEKGLLLLGNHLYDEHYAVSTLREQLRETADRHGEELLESRHDAWCRLLAIFRAIHGGIEHDELRLPPYGGSLFDPDRYPFLEGRAPNTKWQATPAQPLEINNRVVLHLLEALQTLETKLPGTSERQRLRLSFRALDIEQIGHVYEGLLDHTAKRARGPVLGLVGKKGEESEISLEEVEAQLAMGREALVAYLAEATGKQENALGKLLDLAATEQVEPVEQKPVGKRGRPTAAPALDAGKLRIACGNDDALIARVTPFAALLREDTFGRPLVFPAGSLYVTAGSDRRSTGTHYTPRSLTEPIVQHTLEPLVYIGPAEGLSKDQWKLKSAKELLALKVCDLAMGSGAFLVQTCRYLGERLVEAWEETEKSHPGSFITTPEGELSSGAVTERLLPADPAERLAIARRYVADRCLYGVDINPMAVEMAKLSLWLITLQRDRPFTFLDHALKCGDSLLGVSALPQIENFSLRPGERQVTFATANLLRYVEHAGQKRRELEDLPSNDHTQIETKNRLHAEAEAATAKVKALADCLIALELRGLDGDVYADARETDADLAQRLLEQDADAALKSPISTQQSALAAHAQEKLRGRRPFHWPVEFPEVFARGGFDAYVGNPPFMGGTLATDAFGSDYMGLLQQLNPPWHGKADYVVGFFKRAIATILHDGKMSFVATASLLRGESLDSGLRDLMRRGATIYAARSSYKWPGTANLEVVNVSLAGVWSGEYLLDGESVEGITEELTPGVPDDLVPFELPNRSLEGLLGVKLCPANREISFDKYRAAVADAPELEQFYVPALGGDELYDLLDVRLARRSIAPQKLASFLDGGGVLSQQGGITIGSPRTYAHSAPASALTEKLRQTQLAFACGETSTILRFAQVPTQDCILKHKLVVFPAGTWAIFALLQSDFHVLWCWRWGLRRKRDLVYSPKRCAFTFPLPDSLLTQLDASDNALATAGQGYHEFRFELMQARKEGLTKTYNRFHDQGEKSADIARLRALHVELDQAVAAAYGWSDLDLGYGFHATKQGERYTISDPARRTVLDRLLALNHQRYAEEVKAGLHAKGSKKGRANTITPKGITSHVDVTMPPQQDLFSDL